ncbi:phosphonate metabolism transcriptional regulator PhnF [Roseibium sp. M-1]
MRNETDLWRKVSDNLQEAIKSGKLTPGERLPASSRLAEEFGVHQHTVLKAISYLQDHGLLRVEQGRGTFVVEHSIAFRLGRQTWFEQNLSEQSQMPSRHILSVATGPAEPQVHTALGMPADSQLVCARLLGEANGVPIYIGKHYFGAEKCSGIDTVLEDLKTRGASQLVFADILSQFGITGLRRSGVKIRSRLPDNEECRYLQCSPRTPLMETYISLSDSASNPIVYGISSYVSDRVELTIDL